MKKVVKIIVTVLIIIAIIIGIILGVKNILYNIKKENLTKESWVKNNVSLVTSDINKDILKVKKDKDIAVYNMTYQKVINDKINGLNSGYTFDKPLMIYNPYGTDNNSINIYFNTDNDVKVSYKIKVNGYTDFSKNLKGDYSKEHSYKLIGFVMGKTNKLTLTLTDKDGNTDEKTYSLDFSNYKSAKENKKKQHTNG